MAKRILSLLMTAILIVGMLPTVAIAAETSTEPAPVLHAVNGTVTPDGVLDEANWSLSGHLNEESRFGAIYGGGVLYLGFDSPWTSRV